MNTERLQTLSAHLKALPTKGAKRRFDMGVWAQKLKAEAKVKYNCGTAACAGGEAAFIPEFRRLGLKAETDTCIGGIEYKGEHDLDALRSFFGLNSGQAKFVFLATNLKSPRKVAERIDALVTLEQYSAFEP